MATLNLLSTASVSGEFDKTGGTIPGSSYGLSVIDATRIPTTYFNLPGTALLSISNADLSALLTGDPVREHIIDRVEELSVPTGYAISEFTLNAISMHSAFDFRAYMAEYNASISDAVTSVNLYVRYTIDITNADTGLSLEPFTTIVRVNLA
jgi:hypothetical protein